MSSSGSQISSTSRKSAKKSAFGTRDIHSMQIEKVVGSGMYGVVYKAVDKVSWQILLQNSMYYFD